MALLRSNVVTLACAVALVAYGWSDLIVWALS